jgi:L-lactate dehydrogenase complex protein LldG
MVDVQEKEAPVSADRLVAELTTRLQPLNVPVERVSDSAAGAAFLENVRTEIAADELIISTELASAAPALLKDLTAAGVPWQKPVDVAATRDAPLGVSLARLAIAETGSAMLVEETREDRAVGMLTKTNVIVVRTETIVPSLDEAGAELREHALRPGGGYASLVTGPSRTADIELSLSLGVQGPERIYVLVVDDLT